MTYTGFAVCSGNQFLQDAALRDSLVRITTSA